MTLTEILSRLERVKRSGSGYAAKCPAHEDRTASLTLAQGDKGVVLDCKAGCKPEDVVARMGLEMKDLFDEPLRQQPKPKVAATYDYVDEQGQLLFQAVRMEPKDFRQRQQLPGHAKADNDGWVWSLGNDEREIPHVRRVLYRLPEILAVEPGSRKILLCEGEKDVEAIRATGGVATCNPMGAGKWDDSFSEMLRGHHVVIVADRDGPGIKHARAVALSLEGVAASTQIVQAAEGKDASDHLGAGHKLEDFLPLDEESPADGLVFAKFSSIRAETPEWVNGFEDFIPFGAITLLAGEQGTNKSTLACLIAAVITSYHDGDVIYITTEGDPGIEIKPRLLAAGAIEGRCHYVTKRIEGFDDIVAFPTDIRELEAGVKKFGVKLIVIDPALAHVSVDDTNNDSSIRTALAPLQMMAQRNRCVVLLIAHINKDRSTDPFKRVGGSKGLTGVARSCLMMGTLNEGEELRALASFKTSWAAPPQALTFRITSEYVPEAESHHIRAMSFGRSNVKAHHLLAEGRGQKT